MLKRKTRRQHTSRKCGESVQIGEDIIVSVDDIRGGTVRLRIDMPDGTKIVPLPLDAIANHGKTSLESPAD